VFYFILLLCDCAFSTAAMAAQACVQLQRVSLDKRRLILRPASKVHIRCHAVRHAAKSDDTYVAATKLRQLSDLPGTSCSHANESWRHLTVLRFTLAEASVKRMAWSMNLK
jgi:hypothetical protein